MFSEGGLKKDFNLKEKVKLLLISHTVFIIVGKSGDSDSPESRKLLPRRGIAYINSDRRKETKHGINRSGVFYSKDRYSMLQN